MGGEGAAPLAAPWKKFLMVMPRLAGGHGEGPDHRADDDVDEDVPLSIIAGRR